MPYRRLSLMLAGWLAAAIASAHADWLDQFTWRQPHPHDVALTALAIQGNTVVASGDRGTLVTGTTTALQPVVHDYAHDISGLAFGNGRWVAVGSDGSSGLTATSSDGVHWSYSVEPARWNDVLFDDGMFISVGGEIRISTDGIDWMPATIPDLIQAYCGGDTFSCGVGDFDHVLRVGSEYWATIECGRLFSNSGGLLTSPDGLVWTVAENPFSSEWLPEGVADFGSDQFFRTRRVTPGYTSETALFKSVDLAAPEPVNLTLPETAPEWVGLLVVNDQLLAVAKSGMVIATTNGATWSIVTQPGDETLARVRPMGDDVLAVDAHGALKRWNATTAAWTETTRIHTALNVIYNVAFADGIFIAVGNHVFLRSVDGAVWDPLPNKGEVWHAIQRIDDKFLALAASGRIDYSSDGSSWESTTVGSVDLHDLAYGAGRWVATGTDPEDPAATLSFTSTDLVSWDPLDTPAPLTEVEYGNGVFVGPGLLSEDGLDWQLVPESPGGSPKNGIRFHKGTFWGLRTYANSEFFTSTDGITWAHLTPEVPTGSILNYAFDPKTDDLLTLHAGGFEHGGQKIGVTADGIHFTGHDSLPDKSTFLTGITEGLGTVVVVGDHGRIFQSAVDPATTPAALVNVSSRGLTAGGSETQIAGFVVPPGPDRMLLIRVAGPALADHGVEGFSADPSLRVFQGSDAIASNDDWQDDGNGAELEAAFAQTGAFPFTDGSKDAAVLLELSPGAYTAQFGGDAGVNLVEVYLVGGDALETTPLSNLSIRALSSAGEDVLASGVVISGEAGERLLIRAAGPGLSAFGVEGVMSDPTIEVYRGAALIGTITSEETASSAEEIAQVSAEVGAFPFEAGSLDVADVRTLSPGAYTFHVRSASGESGVVLFELYRVTLE